jgi:hypothetical protein
MEYQKVVIMVAVFLAVMAIYFVATSQVPEAVEENSTAASELLMKGMRFGLGSTNYVFAYTEIADDYTVKYLLERDGDNRSITVENPLSVKKAFFTENETMMCIQYPTGANETCAYITDETDLDNYVDSLSSKFLNDAIIERNKNDVEYLIENDYLTIEPGIETNIVDGNECGEIIYSIDFTNISLSDAARFGISSSTPKQFDWRMCIDNQTGMIYEKYFNYTLDGMVHTYEIKAATFSKGTASVILPNETADSITTILTNERVQYAKLAGCYNEYQDAERDDCISDLAITLERKDICLLADGKTEMCLMSLVPMTKDQAICDLITNSNYVDDCYIELAGAYKNSSYCDAIVNTTKIEQCYNISISQQAE